MTTVVLGSPRKLPRPASLIGRVAVVDIAFAAEGTGTSFEKVTGAFIKGLGERLVAWVDHHDHVFHQRFASDPRFVLARKSEHGACPEMVTPELVARIGPVDTLVCHDDLDGLYAAAKWLRGGIEPYAGADDDARAVDTRIGETSALGTRIDRALRARPRDNELRQRVVSFLARGADDAASEAAIDAAASEFQRNEDNARALAKKYETHGARTVVANATGFVEKVGPYDKTLALMLGQAMRPIAVVYDDQTVTLAAAFDSGIDLLAMLGIQGGMPTRVSVPRTRLDEALARIERR